MSSTRRPLTPLEVQLAEQFVNARTQAVALTVVADVELGPLLAFHEQLRDGFAAKYQTPLTDPPFFIKAALSALRQVPVFRSHIDGADLVTSSALDVSIVIDAHAPVLRACDTLSIAQITTALADLSAKTRAGQLTLADLQGGVLTLACHASGGPLFATPAINLPQSAAMSLFPSRDPLRMNLALAFDARLISSAAAAEFVACFKAALAEPLHLLLGI